MEQACANDNIGYDQSNRLSCWVQAEANKWDLSKITTKCECDCTSLMAVCIKAAGIDIDKAMTDVAIVLKTNKFVALTNPQYLTSGDYLKRGDLLESKDHVAICLTNGPKANVPVPPEPKKEEFKVIGKAVAKDYMNIRSGATTSASIYGTISPKTTVQVIEVLSSGWYKIVWEKASVGYAYTCNIDNVYYTYYPDDANPEQPTKIQEKVTATAYAQSFSASKAGTYVAIDDLNLRNGPSTDYKILVTMPKGQVVNNYGYYTSARGIWLYIQFTYKGTLYTGFAASNYLKKK
jgi:hypothetical protein